MKYLILVLALSFSGCASAPPNLSPAAVVFALWFVSMCVPAALVWLVDRHTRAGGDR